MGLLDNDPTSAGLLGLGLRLMATPGPFGQALGVSGLGAINDMQEARTRQLIERRTALEDEARRVALQRALEEQQQRAKDMQLTRTMMEDGSQGPTLPNDPRMFLSRGGSLEGVQNLMGLNAALSPKADDYKVVGNSLVRIGNGKVSEAYRPPETPKEADPNKPFMMINGQIVPNPAYQKYELEKARAGASSNNISVSTGDKKLPATVVKYQDEIVDKLTTARSMEADLGAIEKQIDSGALKFGPVQNLISQGKNMVGMSDENSRNFATFKSSLEKLRNDSLRLNTGVQTEGDAQREWATLFQNITDQELVKKRLSEIRKINQRAAQLQAYRLQVLRDNFDAQSLPSPAIDPVINSGGGSARKYNPATGKIE